MLGREHPGTLGTIDNLANALGGQGKYEMAEQIYLQTFMLSEKVVHEA